MVSLPGKAARPCQASVRTESSFFEIVSVGPFTVQLEPDQVLLTIGNRFMPLAA